MCVRESSSHGRLISCHLAPDVTRSRVPYTVGSGMGAKRGALVILLAATAALAQDTAPPGIFQGSLESWTGTSRSGEFVFRAGDRLYSCSYDRKTYFGYDNRQVTLASADQGERMQVVSDRRPGSSLCYARIVQLFDPQPVYIVPGVRPHPRPAAALLPLFRPHSSLSLSGVVIRQTADALILRTRSGERKTVRLRPDTRYLTEGQVASVASLAANTIVYVRGGRNLYDQIEAYQVIWGEILQPVR
jgi:hypothetical protein